MHRQPSGHASHESGTGAPPSPSSAPASGSSNGATVVQSLTAAIEALPIGAPLPFTRLAQLAYAADPAVTNVTSILLNGAASDLIPSASGLVKPGLIQVN